jgi:hypothetical protein
MKKQLKFLAGTPISELTIKRKPKKWKEEKNSGFSRKRPIISKGRNQHGR